MKKVPPWSALPKPDEAQVDAVFIDERFPLVALIEAANRDATR